MADKEAVQYKDFFLRWRTERVGNIFHYHKEGEKQNAPWRLCRVDRATAESKHDYRCNTCKKQVPKGLVMMMLSQGSGAKL